MSARRILLASVALGILAAPLAAAAQQPAKVSRIGYLGASLPTTVAHLLEAFRQGLGDLGYVEGQNVVIEFRSAEGRLERLPELAAELVRLKVDLIVAAGGPSVHAAKQATGTIPVVFPVHPDPVGAGLVASLARPGGNVTGLSNLAPELGGKRLQLLKEVAPRVSRVAILWNPATPSYLPIVRETEAAAQTLGVRLQILEVRGPTEFEAAFGAATKGRASALIVVEDPLTVTHRKQIVDFAAKRRLPAMYGVREFVDAGGLMAYGVHLADLFRRAATHVDKILKGAKPADLPVEQPTRFELVINLKTAKALGLTVPPSILVRANQLIQ